VHADRGIVDEDEREVQPRDTLMPLIITASTEGGAPSAIPSIPRCVGAVNDTRVHVTAEPGIDPQHVEERLFDLLGFRCQHGCNRLSSWQRHPRSVWKCGQAVRPERRQPLIPTLEPI
jgi:hypothetical protein